MNTESAIDWDEIFEYLPGTMVELKGKPGVLHQIDCYEAMMVPPIWLVDDPRPRYPIALYASPNSFNADKKLRFS
jgi:hypothetical protein